MGEVRTSIFAPRAWFNAQNKIQIVAKSYEQIGGRKRALACRTWSQPRNHDVDLERSALKLYIPSNIRLQAR